MNPLIILSASTVLIVLINLYIGLKNRTSDFESFVTLKNRIGVLPITFSLIGTIIGGGMFFSVGEMGFESGLAPISIAFSYVIGFALLGIIMKRLKNLTALSHINTIYDIVEQKIGDSNRWSRIYNISMSFINFVIYFFMLAGQFLVLAAFYNYFFEISGELLTLLSVIVIGISVIIYSALGGLKKDIATDIFQSSLVIIVLIITSVIILRSDNPFLNFDNLPTQYMNGTGYGVIFPIGVLLFYSPAFIGRYDFLQRVISAKSTNSAIKSLWLSIPIILLAYFFFVYLGMYAKANAGTEVVKNVSVLWSLERITPNWAFVLICFGLYAAVMSTADTLLNVTSISLWQLFNTNKTRSNRTYSLRNVKSLSFIIGVLSILVILIADSVVTLIVGAFSSIVIFTPSIIYIIYSKKPSSIIATLSLVIPYILYFFLFLFLASIRMYAFVPCFILAGLIISIGSLIECIKNKKAVN